MDHGPFTQSDVEEMRGLVWADATSTLYPNSLDHYGKVVI
jgi:hypothetical protein